jgi:tetratricopeptide (TPR) repeat protein
VLEPTAWQPDSRRLAGFLNSENFERFLGLYMRAMDLDGSEPAYPWNLGSALNRLGRPDLALAFVGRAVKTGEAAGDDDWAGPDGYLFWAETAINAGQDDLAFVAIAKAAAQAPDDDETGEAAVRLLQALADARKKRGAARGNDLPVWVQVTPASGSRSSEELMARLIERAFPTAAPARKNPRRVQEPV